MNDAIKMFEDIKTNYDKWYMARDLVSIAQMMERDDLFRKCDWAIKTLKAKIGEKK